MMSQFAWEAYRALKPGEHMSILVGDTRIRKHYVLQVLLEAGFTLCEGVVKIQHKMNTTRKKCLRLQIAIFARCPR